MAEGLIVVVMPALNEERTVAEVIGRVPVVIDGLATRVLVDDGSSDRTAELARAAGAEVVSHPRTLGVGAAFRTGLARALAAGATAVVTIDSDGQFSPEDIPAVAGPVLRGEADMATASRFIDPALVPKMPWVKKWGNRRMAALVSKLTGQRFHDVACGFRAYSRRAAASLNLTGKFTYTQEVFLGLAFRDFAIREVPIEVRGVREFGESRVASNLWRYGTNTLKIIFRCYRDYKPMRFFGTIATGLICPGLVLWGFLAGHYASHGRFSPHIWAGFTGAFLIAFGLVSLITGLLADMLDRIRLGVEEILLLHRSGGRDGR
jgi:glycosyltransferase involved in cell wall biosynthesis